MGNLLPVVVLWPYKKDANMFKLCSGMNILVASGGMKDVYTSVETYNMVEKVLRVVGEDNFNIIKFPCSDGGEYFYEILLFHGIGKEVDVDGIYDPIGNRKKSSYVLCNNNVSFIGSSAILGLGCEYEEYKNPLELTSYGLGQLIRHALDNGATKIHVGLGGTSTVDAGLGMAKALGAGSW